MTALLLIALTAAHGNDKNDEKEMPPPAVQKFIDAMDAQREQVVERLMIKIRLNNDIKFRQKPRLTAKDKLDIKQGKEIEQGADFMPTVYQWRDDGGDERVGTVSFLPCGMLRLGEIEVLPYHTRIEFTVTGEVEDVDEQVIVVRLDFVKKIPRYSTVVTDIEGNYKRGQRYPAREFKIEKVVRIEGIDTSKYTLGDEFESEQVFERIENKEGTVVLRPFDMAAFKNWRERHKPMKTKPKNRAAKRTKS